MSQVRIRVVRVSDRDLVERAQRAGYKVHPERGIVVAATVDGHPIGLMACVRTTNAKHAATVNAHIDAAWRSKGIGRAMYERLKVEAERRGIYRLESIVEPRSRLAAMMNREGWNPGGEHPLGGVVFAQPTRHDRG